MPSVKTSSNNPLPTHSTATAEVELQIDRRVWMCSVFALLLTAGAAFGGGVATGFVLDKEEETPSATTASVAYEEAFDVSGFGTCDNDTITVERAWMWTQHPAPLEVTLLANYDILSEFKGRNSIAWSVSTNVTGFDVLGVDGNTVHADRSLTIDGPSSCHFTLDSVIRKGCQRVLRKCFETTIEDNPDLPTFLEVSRELWDWGSAREAWRLYHKCVYDDVYDIVKKRYTLDLVLSFGTAEFEVKRKAREEAYSCAKNVHEMFTNQNKDELSRRVHDKIREIVDNIR